MNSFTALPDAEIAITNVERTKSREKQAENVQNKVRIGQKRDERNNEDSCISVGSVKQPHSYCTKPLENRKEIIDDRITVHSEKPTIASLKEQHWPKLKISWKPQKENWKMTKESL